MNRYESVEVRFHQQYVKGTEDECWIWLGCFRGKYGCLKKDGKRLSAHRVSYEIYVRSLDIDELVCHTCDNPACVNPNHLFAGTQRKNMQDMCAKGRHRSQKIDPNEHGTIVLRLLTGDSQKQVVRDYGVKASTINAIARKYGVREIDNS